MLSTAEDQEPYNAILTMEATAINSEDSLSSADPLVHSKVVCMLITKFVSVYKRAEQFQQWQVMKQQPNQTVKAFLTKVASMGAIGGYQCSTALLTMATGLTPKASNTIAECRQLQLLESQKESIDGTKSTMLDLLDSLNQTAYIHMEDAKYPGTAINDRVKRPTDIGVGVPKEENRKCRNCGQVGHREFNCTNPAACNWCMSKDHFRLNCPTAPKVRKGELAVTDVKAPVASVKVERRGATNSGRGTRGMKRRNED